jgi:hypothetical protein
MEWEIPNLLLPPGFEYSASMTLMLGEQIGGACVTGNNTLIFVEATQTNPPGTTFSSSGSFQNIKACLIDGTQGGITTTQVHVDYGGASGFDAVTPNNTVVVLRGSLEVDNDFNLGQSNQFDTWYMAEGAEVIVRNPGHLILKEIAIQGCDHMWKGIDIRGKSSTTIYADLGDRNQIRDAAIGLKANYGSTLNIRQVDFINNYLGIYVPPIPSNQPGGQEADLNDLWSLNFETNGSFLSTYEGQTLIPSNVGFAGIEIHDLPPLSISGILNGPPPPQFLNSFTNLANGIIAYNTTLQVFNTTFEDIQTESAYAISGRAISLESPAFGGSASGLIQKGYGNGEFDDPSFLNCHTGIFLQNANANISQNRMEKMTRGIDAQYSYLTEMEIKDNFIEAEERGVNSLINFNQYGAIYDNEIRMDNSAMPTNSVAVLCNEGPLAASWQVNNNVILLDRSRDGIFLRSSLDSRVRNNSISMDVLNQYSINRYNGIWLEYSQFGEVACNDIDGNASLGSSNYKEANGVVLTGSPANAVNCNDVDRTRYGLQVYGMCDGSQLQGNTIRQHRHGLMLGEYDAGGDPDGNAFLGQQIHHGNEWLNLNNTNPNTGDGRYGAVHLSDEANILNLSRLIVDENEDFRFEPETDLPFYAGPTTDWVEDNPDPSLSFKCATENVCPNGTGYQGFTTPLDEAIAQDSLITHGHTNGLTWTARRHLYRRYLEQPSLAPGTATVLDSFFLDAPSETAGAYEDWLADLRTALRADSAQNAQLEVLRGGIRQQLIQVYLQDSLLQTGLSTPDSLQALTDRQAALDSLLSLHTAQDSVRKLVVDSLAVELSILSTANLSLSAATTYESNQRSVNRILAALLQNGNTALDSTANAQLEAIADQCPFSGGDAVYMARALLGKHFYNDADLCEPGRRATLDSHEQEATQPLVFRPNPAASEVRFDLPATLEGAWQLQLLDSQGRLVKVFAGSSAEHTQVLDLNALPAGMYFAQLLTRQGVLHTGRLIILH